MTGPAKSVLIVEDDGDVRGALAAILEGEGYTVVEAAHGQEALQHLRGSNPFCLILLDLWMPVMDGWGFRAEQVKDPKLAQIPVLVITADHGAVKKAAALGVAGTLTKPIEFDQLLEFVGRVC
jgi:CheY-like chemotaxis protein